MATCYVHFIIDTEARRVLGVGTYSDESPTRLGNGVRYALVFKTRGATYGEASRYAHETLLRDPELASLYQPRPYAGREA